MEGDYLYAIISKIISKGQFRFSLVATYALSRTTFCQMCAPYRHESDLPFG